MAENSDDALQEYRRTLFKDTESRWYTPPADTTKPELERELLDYFHALTQPRKPRN